MEQPESSLPYSQAPATCPYPEPTPSSPHNPFPTSWRSILILSSRLSLGLPNGLSFPQVSPTKTLCSVLDSQNQNMILLKIILRVQIKFWPRARPEFFFSLKTKFWWGLLTLLLYIIYVWFYRLCYKNNVVSIALVQHSLLLYLLSHKYNFTFHVSVT